MTRFVLACALLLGACEKKAEDSPQPAKPAGDPQPARPEPAKAEPTPAPASPAGLVGGGRMQHCPTAVPGSTTTINVTADSVELMIVAANDEKAAKDIVSDAKHLKEVAQKDPAQVKHTGEGEGGGGLGKCPVVLKDTHITITEIPGGAKIALKPMKPEQLDWLRKEVEARQAKAMMP